MSTKPKTKSFIVHVLPATPGKWKITGLKNAQERTVFNYKADAVAEARKLGSNAEVVIHNKEGVPMQSFGGKTTLTKSRIREAVTAISTKR